MVRLLASTIKRSKKIYKIIRGRKNDRSISKKTVDSPHGLSLGIIINIDIYIENE